MKRANWIAIAVATVTLVACATSPLGRRQLLLMPAAQMDQMGLTAYSQLKQQTPLSTNQAQISYVRCVSNALTATLDGTQNWEINLFEDPTANAFALPGGFMGVHTGLLKVAQNQHQLAAVVGHEIGHVLAQHPAGGLGDGHEFAGAPGRGGGGQHQGPGFTDGDHGRLRSSCAVFGGSARGASGAARDGAGRAPAGRVSSPWRTISPGPERILQHLFCRLHDVPIGSP